MKHSAPKKGIVGQPMISSELNSRCSVGLVDLQSNRDGEYMFLMVYQDHLTKFVHLRPLKTNKGEENSTYHEGILQSPYAAIFGIKAKRGIASSFLPSEEITNIKTKVQLEEITKTFETEEQLEETGNISEKN
ncbi:KRAB-A domain-containing protein 2 [Trichonephila clavipes]|nr:KRAB-A domain-containing protein 2 [Trichonephila clavipes]